MRQRIQVIDGMRGVSILLVMLFHYTHIYPNKLGSGGTALFQLPWGGVGVSIFFVVSGLVIMKSLDKSTLHSFAISRFSRLYPTYMFCLTLTTLALLVWGDWYRHVSLVQYMANATMMQYYLGFQNVDGVYWSLRVEIVFYAISALLFYRLKSRAFWHVLLIFSVIAFLGNLARSSFDLPETVLILPKILVFDFIHYFMIGIVCFKILFDSGSENHPVWMRNILLALAVVSFLDLLVNKQFYKFVAISITVMVLTAASKRPQSAVARAMRSRPIQYLGKISYSLYLLHQVIGYLLLRILQELGIELSFSIVLTTIFILALVRCASVIK